MQMELAYWPRGCVRAVLADYVNMRAENCSVETIQEDYRYRVDWLHQVFGELTPAVAVSYDVLERAARAGRSVFLKDVTIKKRLAFWNSACRYAIQRGRR